MPRLGPLAVAATALALLAAVAAPAFAADPPTPAAGHHLMIDAMSAPPLTEIEAWQANSPYSAIAVYIPVTDAADNRSDKDQTELSNDWVSEVEAGGWRVLPTYVGLQAPCPQPDKSFNLMSAEPATAHSEGVSAANDATGSAMALGLSSTIPIIYDLEAYRTGDSACTAAVQAFLAGWTTRLHQLGRHSGVYGSIGSTMNDVVAVSADASYPKPDVIWEATWNGSADTTFSTTSMGRWPNGRINQFSHDVDRSYGGQTLRVDENAVQDFVWTLATPDGTAPTLAAAAPPATTKATRAAISWAHNDPSGIAAYTVRTRHAAPGAVLGAWSAPARTTASSRTFALRPGEAWCVTAQATDRAGNASAWSAPRCTARFADDTSLHAGKGWKRARGGYLGTSSKATRKGAVLRGPRVAGTSVTVVLRARGAVVVRIGSTVVGIVRGAGTHQLTLRSPVSGQLTLRTQSRAKTVVDAYLVT
ncbi:DUF1906 domain-containing protein [Nocardioides sp. Kera G14]|uniref:DUF1906 domain-containing protein n=1 Tax=Nocardioides sp. Kera G14 TaxID=2884264 RepID=UPI001D109647|nr:DUF1906 domain-containing protein [Nocardioides sp. Kera G14]UDY24140.1 DUF1906 domain-containing protein [Nocardioides sp. Kera G14]